MNNEKEYSVLLESFRNSYFVRSIKYPELLGYDNKEDKQSIIDEKTRIILNDISYKDGKYYLSGFYKVGEHVLDYSQFSDYYNEITRIGTHGNYESVAYFINNDLIFETNYSAYRTIVGTNEELSSIHNNIYDKKSSVVNNFIEKVSGIFEEEFIYEPNEDVYIHKSKTVDEIETLKYELKDEDITLLKYKPKSDFNLVPRKQYSELKNERDRLINKINRETKENSNKIKKISDNKESKGKKNRTNRNRKY